jgi:hypothetical protein
MDEDILTEEELKRAVQKIFKLSQMDPKFRTLCLSNSNEAIHLITGKTVPLHIKIQFVDSPPDEANKSSTATT